MGVYKQVHKVTLKHCVGDRYRMDEAVDGLLSNADETKGLAVLSKRIKKN